MACYEDDKPPFRLKSLNILWSYPCGHVRVRQRHTLSLPNFRRLPCFKAAASVQSGLVKQNASVKDQERAAGALPGVAWYKPASIATTFCMKIGLGVGAGGANS